jgi:hypothetical protein
MAVQKKKKQKKQKTSKKNPTNPNIFNWTGQRKNAALLISEGEKTYQEIAEEVGVHRETFWEWRNHPIFQDEVRRLTLENEKATREGLLRLAYNAVGKKLKYISEDKSTLLDWVKFIADLQGHVKQKVELDANMKHSVGKDPSEMTDEELQQALENETKKLIDAGVLPNFTKNKANPK